MKESITSDLLRESIEKETRKLALNILKHEMSAPRFENDDKPFFYWLDEDEIPLIINAMIRFVDIVPKEAI